MIALIIVGLPFDWLCFLSVCLTYMGVDDNYVIKNSQMSASSFSGTNTPGQGRLFGDYSWQPRSVVKDLASSKKSVWNVYHFEISIWTLLSLHLSKNISQDCVLKFFLNIFLMKWNVKEEYLYNHWNIFDLFFVKS